MSTQASPMPAQTPAQSRERLQVAIVGHVDHGKSTVLGRLLHDTGQVPTDRVEKVRKLCEAQGKIMEYAFLLDALEEEQRQGITIDISQFFWNTPKRQVAFVDAPGHKEFLKNMVSGASTVDAALLIIDAHEGVSEQSRRHGYILHFLGIEEIIVVINKMDLVDYSESAFNEVQEKYAEFLASVGVTARYFVPLSGLHGQNVAKASDHMPWYQGPTLASLLEGLELRKREDSALRFIVQDVYKWDERRILAGRVESGRIRAGDSLVFLPGKRRARVKAIEKWAVGVQPTEAVAGESIGVLLDEQIFVERGQVGAHVEDPPKLSNRVKANVYWMHDEALKVGHVCRVKVGTQAVDAIVEDIVTVLDTVTLTRSDPETLERNQVGEIFLKFRGPIAFDNFSQIKHTGRFVVCLGEAVVGGGIIDDDQQPDMSTMLNPTPVSQNIFMTEASVSHDERFQRQGYRGGVIWMTGLSGSGKSTLARALSRALFEKGVNAYVLDGDNLRHGLNSDLGFSPDDRAENMRRVAEVARLMRDAGIVVISALISPYREARAFARSLLPDDFIEVFIDAPIEVCIERDVKGLYARAKADNIANFTGVSAPYEVPDAPELHVKTHQLNEADALEMIVDYLRTRGYPV